MNAHSVRNHAMTAPVDDDDDQPEQSTVALLPAADGKGSDLIAGGVRHDGDRRRPLRGPAPEADEPASADDGNRQGGCAVADIQREIEQTPDDRGDTLHVLRERGREGRRLGLRIAGITTAVGAIAGAAAASVIVARRRDAGPLTRGSKLLPAPVRRVALPPARSTDRWLGRRGKDLQRGRYQLVDNVALRIAQQLATTERRSNPMLRRAMSRAAEAAAGAAGAAVVQQLIAQRARTDRGNVGGAAEHNHAPTQEAAAV